MELETTRLGTLEQTTTGAVFIFNVRIKSNNSRSAEGTLAIKDHAGNELASVPVVLDAAQAAGETLVSAKHPVRLLDGAYLLHASLQYHEVVGQAERDVTYDQDFELKIGGGLAEVSRV